METGNGNRRISNLWVISPLPLRTVKRMHLSATWNVVITKLCRLEIRWELCMQINFNFSCVDSYPQSLVFITIMGSEFSIYMSFLAGGTILLFYFLLLFSWVLFQRKWQSLSSLPSWIVLFSSMFHFHIVVLPGSPLCSQMCPFKIQVFV